MRSSSRPPQGARGVVWRAKYRDADGVQVRETLGRATDGWTKRKAEAALRARLTDVERHGLRKVKPETFATFAREWLDTYPATKGLKRSTVESYTTIVERHLIPAFGARKLDSIDVRAVESYVAGKRRAGFAPRSVNRQLNLLHELFRAAVKQGLARGNPVAAVDRPPDPRRSRGWAILSPAEIGRVERALAAL